MTKHYPTNMPPIYGIGIPLWQLTQGFWYPTTPGETQLRPVIAVKESDSLYLTTYGRIVESDQLCTSPPDAYIKAPYYPTCDTSYEQWSCSNVYYLYFDSAVTMSDSFYFGVAIKGPCGGLFLSGRYGACEYPSLDEEIERLLCPFLEQYDSTVFSHARPYSEVAEGTFANIPFILLFNPPDTDSFDCPLVQNLRVAEYRDGRPMFNWDRAGGQQPFQIAFGPADEDPDSYRVVTAASPPYLLPDLELDSTVVYAARCRGRCHHTCVIHDTILWSEWSDTIHFTIGRDTPEGIVPVERGEVAFVLSPNPAKERVTVAVGEDVGMPCMVVLRDEQGRELLRQRMEGRELTLSTRGLAAGVCLVTVESPRGSSTQKLVVEN